MNGFMNGLLTYISIIPFPDDVNETMVNDIEIYRSSDGEYNICLRTYTYTTFDYDDFMLMVSYINKAHGVNILERYFDNNRGTK